MSFPSKESLKEELLMASIEFSFRGLKQSALWCAEQGNSIQVDENSSMTSSSSPYIDVNFYAEMSEPSVTSSYIFAKTLFDNKEYKRATYQLASSYSVCPKCSFLKHFSQFLAIETKRMEDLTEPLEPISVNITLEGNGQLQELMNDLYGVESQFVDGYHLYLMGLVSKRLGESNEAKNYFVQSVNATPMLYASWFELKSLITTKDELKSVKLPAHWMRECFFAEVHANFQMNVDVVDRLQPIFNAGFSNSPHFYACLAKAHHSLRDFESSIECFEELRKLDPYRLEDLDTLSNDYYVKSRRVELSVLAHEMVEISKYRHETCCVIGNYYSFRQEHEKAVTYFQRALKLNPNYISAWTLMGHELIEMKNTNAAVQAYRRAVEIDPKDFRAWYGLGQTYEILRMPLYSIIYFQQALIVRPNDSRFLLALGHCFESLDKTLEAEKCYWKAYSVGDSEGKALLKLGRIFEKQDKDKDKEEKAVTVYQRYIEEVSQEGTIDFEEQGGVYLYLAKHYFNNELLEKANELAVKASLYKNTKEAARSLQKDIIEKRKKSLRSNPSSHLQSPHTIDLEYPNLT